MLLQAHTGTCMSTAQRWLLWGLSAEAFPARSYLLVPKLKFHLIVATAPSMQLAPDSTNDLSQAPLVGCMDVLIPCLDLEVVAFPLLAYLLEPMDDGAGLFICQHARLGKRPGVCLAALRFALAPFPSELPAPAQAAQKTLLFRGQLATSTPKGIRCGPPPLEAIHT